MSWMSKVRMVCNAVVDTAVDATASTLTTCGVVACAAGGMGFSLSQAMQKTFRASYYGAGVGHGGLNVSGFSEEFKFGINYTLPVQISGIKDGETNYCLSDYTDPSMVQWLSATCVGSGIVLKALGDNLKKWQQYRYDSRYAREAEGILLNKPSAKEYLYTSASSFFTSLSVATLSHTISSSLVYYSQWFNADLFLTYPFKREENYSKAPRVESPYYDGPIVAANYPVTYILDPQKVVVDVPIFGNVTLLLKMALNGHANVTYGGGLFFKENAAAVPPAITQSVSGVVGASAYLTANFFAEQERKLYKQRLKDIDNQLNINEPALPVSLDI